MLQMFMTLIFWGFRWLCIVWLLLFKSWMIGYVWYILRLRYKVGKLKRGCYGVSIDGNWLWEMPVRGG